MVQLQAQEDLTGKKLEFEKERVETWKDVFKGKFFQVTVSEESHDKLDRLREKGADAKARKWIAEHMKPYITLPEGNEGEMFQRDLELFVRIL